MLGKSKLRSFFEKRLLQFNALSTRIKKELSYAILPGCTDYMTKQHPSATSHIMWVGFSLSQHQGNDTVSLFGRIEFNEGDEYTDPDGNVHPSLSWEEADYISTMFQIVIPLALAEKGTHKEVVAYLAEQDEKAKQLIKEYIAQQKLGNDEDLIYEGTDLSEEEIQLAKLISKNSNDILQ